MFMNVSIRRLFSNLALTLALVLFSKGTVKAAEVFFNDVYKGELNATIPTYPTESNQIFISLASKLIGTNFSFESLNGALEPTYSGNNVSGYLKYIDASGNAVSIRGVVSRPTKSGSVYEGFYFYVSDNLDNPLGDAYLLVIPGKESLFPGDGSIGTSSDPVDNALNDLLLLPRLAVSGTLSAFSTCSGVPSASQTLSATGYNLTAPIVVTAPAGYEVSTTGAAGTFSGSVSIPIGTLLGGALVDLVELLGDREFALRSPYFLSALLGLALFIFAAPRLTTAKIEAARAHS